MGDSFSRKQNFLKWSITHPLLSVMEQASFYVSYTRGRGRYSWQKERALLELERRWRGGEQWPQTSKTAWLILNCMYTHSHDCIDYSKRGHKSRRRRRRKRPERPGGISNSVATDAGSSTSSFPTPQLSPPTSTGASEPSSVSRHADTHPANLIDFNSPPLTPGENIGGMMHTMNITEQ